MNFEDFIMNLKKMLLAKTCNKFILQAKNKKKVSVDFNKPFFVFCIFLCFGAKHKNQEFSQKRKPIGYKTKKNCKIFFFWDMQGQLNHWILPV